MDSNEERIGSPNEFINAEQCWLEQRRKELEQQQQQQPLQKP